MPQPERPEVTRVSTSFGIDSFEQPDFDLTSVRVDGLVLTGGSLTLLIDVDNPNAYDLRTGQIDVAIDFEGTRFGEAFLDGSTREQRS